ncbi:MAG: hypothetical protein OCC45_08640 [Desulfotalea sp.]
METTLSSANITDLVKSMISVQQSLTLASRRKVIEQRLKTFYSLTMGVNADRINGQDYRFKMCSVIGKKSLDKTKIAEALKTSSGSTKTANEIMQDCTKVSSSYDRLSFSKINRTKARA